MFSLPAFSRARVVLSLLVSLTCGFAVGAGANAVVGSKLTLPENVEIPDFEDAPSAPVGEGSVVASAPEAEGTPGLPTEQKTSVRMDKRIAAEPAGLRATVGDKGEPFSGGEQQRLAFARALLTDAPCLILDETLASLDEDTEMFMLQRLLEDFPEKTMICVSHRKQVATLFTRRIDVKRGGHVRMLEGSV